MPAKDDDHDIVVRSLIKAGWSILKEQEYISIGTSPEVYRRLYIDIKAQSAQGIIVLIEVKSLARSPVHQLMELLGQYLVYRAAHVLGQRVMREHAVPLMVYDPEEEVVQQWIPPL